MRTRFLLTVNTEFIVFITHYIFQVLAHFRRDWQVRALEGISEEQFRKGGVVRVQSMAKNFCGVFFNCVCVVLKLTFLHGYGFEDR